MVRKTPALPNFTALSQHIDPQWIAHALAVTGKASVRRRKLPAEQVVWLVIALAMYRNQSMAQVVAELDLALPDEVNPDIASSALTQARQRLGQHPLAQLFGLCASTWDQRHQRGTSFAAHPMRCGGGLCARSSADPQCDCRSGGAGKTRGDDDI